jgi:hypothetical protein
VKKFFLSIAAALTCTIAAINCAPAQAEPASEVYYALLKHDGEAWCGFRTAVQFQSEATENPPFETARLTYANDQLTEILYQFDAESGDWVVVDQYLPGSGACACGEQAECFIPAERKSFRKLRFATGGLALLASPAWRH